MNYEERNTWSSLIVTIVAMAVYIPVVVSSATDGPPPAPDWLWAMLWTIGTSVTVAIVFSIVWGIASGTRRGIETDERDRHIAQIGGRVGHAFLVIAGLLAILLCALEADVFWIAHTVFFGFVASAVVEGVTRVILYRAGTI